MPICKEKDCRETDSFIPFELSHTLTLLSFVSYHQAYLGWRPEGLRQGESARLTWFWT